jgi:hypothetical protein
MNGDVFPDLDVGKISGVMQCEIDRLLDFLRGGGCGGRHIKDIRLKMLNDDTTSALLKAAKRRGLIERVPAEDIPRVKGKRRYRVKA